MHPLNMCGEIRWKIRHHTTYGSVSCACTCACVCLHMLCGSTASTDKATRQRWRYYVSSRPPAWACTRCFSHPPAVIHLLLCAPKVWDFFSDEPLFWLNYQLLCRLYGRTRNWWKKSTDAGEQRLPEWICYSCKWKLWIECALALVEWSTHCEWPISDSVHVAGNNPNDMEITVEGGRPPHHRQHIIFVHANWDGVH